MVDDSVVVVVVVITVKRGQRGRMVVGIMEHLLLLSWLIILLDVVVDQGLLEVVRVEGNVLKIKLIPNSHQYNLTSRKSPDSLAGLSYKRM